MDIFAIISSQYLAALEMLKQTIALCPAQLWDAPGDKTKVWQLAYHALFYTHLYLQDSEQAFTPWDRHRKDIHRISQPQEGEAYDRESLLEYLAFCQREVERCVPGLELEAESGFDWLPFNKLELQLYNIRHIQQHTGELMERLGERAQLEFRWVGMRPD